MLLAPFELELDISDARPEEKAREVEEEISLPLVFGGFLVPYRLSTILTDWDRESSEVVTLRPGLKRFNAPCLDEGEALAGCEDESPTASQHVLHAPMQISRGRPGRAHPH